MRVATLHAPRDIRLEDRPAPTIQDPTDALARVPAACICGSDLWPYHGEDDLPDEPQPTGHEAVGIVEELGAEVSDFALGDFVVTPLCHSDDPCAVCRKGMQAGCSNGGMTTGGQAEHVRVTQTEAPVRKDLPDPLERTLAGRLDPSPVSDQTLPMEQVAEGYRATVERGAVKVLLQP